MPTLRDWLAAEPFTLTLSAGFFGFFAHAGFLDALEEHDLRPRRITGSSAGALVAGLWAAGMSASDIRDELFALQRKDFWDPWPGVGLLRGRRFRSKLESLAPVDTFEACRVPVAVSVYDVLKRSTRVVDSGPLLPAVQASCTLPVLFHPQWLDRRPVLDGGLRDRHALCSVPPGERLFYHHLASRSPWRAADDAGLEVPRRPNMRHLAIDGLPRVNPFRLERGRLAYAAARDATREALGRPTD